MDNTHNIIQEHYIKKTAFSFYHNCYRGKHFLSSPQHPNTRQHLFLWRPQTVELNEDLHLTVHQAGPPPGQAHLQRVAAPHAEHMAAGLITSKIGNLVATKGSNAEVIKHWTVFPLERPALHDFIQYQPM